MFGSAWILCPVICIKFLKRSCWVANGLQSRHRGRLIIFCQRKWKIKHVNFIVRFSFWDAKLLPLFAKHRKTLLPWLLIVCLMAHLPHRNLKNNIYERKNRNCTQFRVLTIFHTSTLTVLRHIHTLNDDFGENTTTHIDFGSI